ncbi:calA [Symbiodinium microadriaticum]|nr:calA [Symbiodinium microadriaticum]
MILGVPAAEEKEFQVPSLAELRNTHDHNVPGGNAWLQGSHATQDLSSIGISEQTTGIPLDSKDLSLGSVLDPSWLELLRPPGEALLAEAKEIRQQPQFPQCEACRKLLTPGLVVQTTYDGRRVTADLDDKQERNKRRKLKAKVKDKEEEKRPTVNRKLLRAATTKIFQDPATAQWSQEVLALLQGATPKGEMERFAAKVKEVDEKLKELEDAASTTSSPDLDQDDLEDLPPPPAALRRKESVSMMRRFSRQISDDEPEIVAMRLGSRKAVTATDFDARTRSESRDSRMSSKATANVPKADVWDTYQRADDAKSDQLMENLKKDPTEDIFELLTFLGCVFLDRVEVRALMDKTTKYDYMAFDDFESFMVELGENGEDGSMLAGPPVLSLSSSAVSRRPAATDQSAELIARAELMLQVIFDRFDEDGSGTISIEELREMLHYLGFMPNRRMIQEALSAITAGGKDCLDFDQLVLFLLVYRRREGFCRAEAQYSDGDPPLMPVSMLGAALKQAFGRQVHDFAAKVQEQLQKGQIYRSCTSSPDPDYEPEKLRLSDFLIICRNCREDMHKEMDVIWPPSYESESEEKSVEDRGLVIKCNPHGEGTISDEQLRAALKSMDYVPLTKAMLDVYVQVIGTPIPRELDYDEFFDFVWIFRKNCAFSGEELEDIREFFERSDEDGSGEICTTELAQIFRSLGYKASMEEISGFLLEVDFDESGFLSMSEFVTLMGYFRTLELRKIHDVFEETAVDGYLTGTKIGAAFRILGKQMLDVPPEEEDDELDFEDFVDAVDESRHKTMMQERKLAGFGYWKVELLRELFKQFDRDEKGFLELHALTKLLQHLEYIEAPRSRNEQLSIIRHIESARKHAYEAGVRESMLEQGFNVTFWTFVQLCRLLQSQRERQESKKTTDLMLELKFSKFEVEQFRHVFAQWAKWQPDGEDLTREIDTAKDTLTQAGPGDAHLTEVKLRFAHKEDELQKTQAAQGEALLLN